MVTILAGAFGFLGAFVAHDLAAQALADQPLRPGRGTCPNCGTQRGWFRVRCPQCDRRIGRELVAAVIATLVAVGFANTIGNQWALVAYVGFLVLTLALGITDIDAFRIVDRLNLRGSLLVGVALAVASIADANTASMLRALLAAAAYLGGTAVIYAIVRGRGFGFGDVKLSVQLGLFAGYISWGTLGWSVLLTAVIGGVLSIIVLISVAIASRAQARRLPDGEISDEDLVTVRDAMKTELPYGPAMIIGCWLAIIMAGLGAFPIPT